MGELKHLSTPRKINQPRFPKEWRTNGEEPKPLRLSGARAYVVVVLQGVSGVASRDPKELQNLSLVEGPWEGPP